MDFLNPNGSDCTLVLFYTPWCRFSASLAPHFNSLPRAFPALHFLALDASQHSRYLPSVGSKHLLISMIPLPFTLLFWFLVYKPFLYFLSREDPLAFIEDLVCIHPSFNISLKVISSHMKPHSQHVQTLILDRTEMSPKEFRLY